MLRSFASVAVAWHRLLLRDEHPGSGVYLRLDNIVAAFAILTSSQHDQCRHAFACLPAFSSRAARESNMMVPFVGERRNLDCAVCFFAPVRSGIGQIRP